MAEDIIGNHDWKLLAREVEAAWGFGRSLAACCDSLSTYSFNQTMFGVPGDFNLGFLVRVVWPSDCLN